MYQKKEKIFLQKMSPHLSQLNVAMAHRNYFRKDCQMFIFYFVYTKHQVWLIINGNEEIYGTLMCILNWF